MPLDLPLTPLYTPVAASPFSANPEFPYFAASVANAAHLAVAYKGFPFRASPPAYATPLKFFSGAGAAKGGGRWNPPGIHTIYLSLRPETAVAEALAASRAMGIADHESHPLVIEAAMAVVGRALSLRDPAVLTALNLNMKSLITENFQKRTIHAEEARCQAFGRALHAAGIQTLLIPSRIHRHVDNLVVFRLLLGSSERCEPLHPDQLPADKP